MSNFGANMEKKSDSKPRYTRTLYVIDRDRQTLCGKMASMEMKPYTVLKIGRTVHISTSAELSHRAFILDVSRPGAYKIIDRDVTVSVILTETSIEASTEPWNDFTFEMVDARPVPATTSVGGFHVPIEVKHCIGRGIVPPYTSVDRVSLGDLQLPGLEIVNLTIAEQRAMIKERRDEISAQMAMATDDMSESDRRLFGIYRRRQQGQDNEVKQPMSLGPKPKDPAGFAAKEKISSDVQTSQFGDVQVHSDDEDAESVGSGSEDENEAATIVEEQQQVDLKFEKAIESITMTDDERKGARKKVQPTPEADAHLTPAYKLLFEEMTRVPIAGLNEPFGMPGTSGKITSIQKNYISSHSNVPLYKINQKKATFQFTNIGDAGRVVIVLSGGRACLLPTGVKPDL
ncbi:NS2 protein [Wanken orbivirus]|nr:NS2 protein [Wanken orbivirus]